MSSELTIAACATSIPLIFFFAFVAMHSSYKDSKNNNISSFLAAHNSQPLSRVVYSLISTSLGAWVVFLPASYCLIAGYIGLINYAISSGITIIIPSLFGPYIQKGTRKVLGEQRIRLESKEKEEFKEMISPAVAKEDINMKDCPSGPKYTADAILNKNLETNMNFIVDEKEDRILSLSDYVRRRYGIFAQYLVSLICIYSMMIGLIAEYTAIGDLFEFVVRTERIVIVLIVGVSTSFYTSYGGLIASITMDQFQGVFVITMNIIFAIYMMVTFRLDTSRPLTENLDANMLGYDSIAALNIGLAGSVIYSEAFWQKAWLANSPSELRKGSIIAACIVIVIVFLFGFYGFMAAWNGMEASSFNLALFALFQNNQPTWIIVIIVNIAVVMNESAVDSYQIGIVSSISTCFLKDKPLIWTQILVLLINAPLIWLSLASYPMMNLFLSANLITASGSIPLLLGLSDRLKPYYNTINFVFGLIGGLILASVWGWQETGDFEAGLNLIFYLEYRWQSFIICVVGGTVISLIVSAFIWAFKRINGINRHAKLDLREIEMRN